MSILKLPKNAPKTPGVYIFRRGGIPLYVGKAENLKKRLASYFRVNASEKVRTLRAQASRLEWIELLSDVEALIKEAELIKRYRPKFNVLLRDDKNYFYVGFTKEEFPKIFVTHQPFRHEKIQNAHINIRNKFQFQNSTHVSDFKFRASDFSFIGPFTSGSALSMTLRILRRTFPYCTCKEIHRRPCLNAEIGRCLGCCCRTGGTSDETCKKAYRENIGRIAAFLEGRRTSLLRELTAEMKDAVKKEEFERAATLRNQIEGIKNIFLHRKFLNPELTKHRRIHDWVKIERTIQALLATTRRISRVEGYDISNISGTEATGSMVVFINGSPLRNGYRKFKIKTVNQISDVDMHKEVIRRRMNHVEWGIPDFILIDGGKPQLSAARAALKSGARNSKFEKTFIGALAKRGEELFLLGRKNPIHLDSLPPHTMHFFQHVRDESHRFAKKYHHKLREKLFRNDVH